MDSRIGAAQGDTNNFDPSSDLIQEDECDTLLLYLPGFTKEQLRVQLTTSGALRISGARLTGDNKWSSFQKSFPISANCDTNRITAKFEGGILYVKQPKMIVPAEKQDKKIQPSETSQTPTPVKEPPAPKIDQQAHPEKATPSEDLNKKTGVRDSPEKPDQIRKENPTKEKEKNRADVKGNKNDERKYPQEKSDAADIDQKAAERTASHNRKKAAGNIDADLADKGTKYHDIDGVHDYSRFAGSPAARLKLSGQTIKMVLVVFFSFLLGIYVSNLPWFSKNPGN